MKLILFFNGWGVPKSSFDFLKKEPGFDLLIVDLDEDFNQYLEKLKRYEVIKVIGWSFGIYNSLLKFQSLPKDIKDKITDMVALCGSHYPVDKKLGIHPIIFKRTYSSLNQETMREFLSNCGVSLGDREFDIPNLKRLLSHFAPGFQEVENLYTKVIIGRDDKIFPYKNLFLCYNKLDTKIIDGEHFIFSRWTHWNEVFYEFC